MALLKKQGPVHKDAIIFKKTKAHTACVDFLLIKLWWLFSNYF